MKFSTPSISFLAASLSLSGITNAFSVTRSSPLVAVTTELRSSSTNLFLGTDIDKESESAAPPIFIDDEHNESPEVAGIPAFTSGPSTLAETVNAPAAPGIRLTGGEKLRQDGLTGKGVKVGVIDSGIDASHPYFDGKIAQQLWWFGGYGGREHGTHVAGTIHMMAPDADIYDYRIFDSNGRIGGRPEILAQAINEAVEDGCDVINMSLRWSASWDLLRAIRNASQKGVIIVCAAGNSGDGNPLTNEVAYPASFSSTISVAAVSKRDNLPTASFSNSNSRVDYAGIGVNVLSFLPGQRIGALDGTSMASPHVCGLIAALMTKGGAYEDIVKDDASCRALLNENFAIDIGSEGDDNATGLGFLSFLTKDEFEGQFFDLPDFD